MKLLGSLREEDGRGVVRVEDVYPTGIDDPWEALTQPDRLRRWIADVVGDLRVNWADRWHELSAAYVALAGR